MHPMNDATVTPAERFAAVVAAFLDNPEITPPSGQGFGSSGLRVQGKIFAMLSESTQKCVNGPVDQAAPRRRDGGRARAPRILYFSGRPGPGGRSLGR